MKNIITLIILIVSITSLFAGEIKEVTLTVNGQGKTKDEAKFNALRNAIEDAFGAFISSNTSVINDELAKDEITSISSGNIKKIVVLSEIQLPDGSYTTLLNATVSLSKLNDLCKNKGFSSEFSGDLFATNIKLQKHRKENELKILSNVKDIIHSISYSLYDYTIEVSKPKENPGTSGWNKNRWDIPIIIKAKVNSNIKTIEQLFFKTIQEISLTSQEEKELGETNQGTFAIQVNGKQFKLRNKSSYLLVDDIFCDLPLKSVRFKLENGLGSFLGSDIIACAVQRNRTLCGFTPDNSFINVTYSIYEGDHEHGHYVGSDAARAIQKNMTLNQQDHYRIPGGTEVLIINFKDAKNTEVVFKFNNTLPIEDLSKITEYKVQPIIK